MTYAPTQLDMDLLRQRTKKITAKLELLDSGFKTLDWLDASIISMSLSVDATADMRRTGTITVLPQFDGYELTEESALWIDRHVRLYLEYERERDGAKATYLMGTFVADTKTFSYAPDVDQLSVSLVDMSSRLDGTHTGTLGEETLTVEEGSDIRDAMIKTLALAGIRDYVIDPIGSYKLDKRKVPYDIELDGGCTVWDMVAALRDLYPGYEAYFDVNGVFRCNRMPTCESDAEFFPADDFDYYVETYSEERATQFSYVKNVAQAYGDGLDNVRCFVSIEEGNLTMSGNAMQVTESAIKQMDEYLTVAVVMPHANTGTPYLQVNSMGSYSVVEHGNKPVAPGRLRKDSTYVFEWHPDISKWLLLGSYQPTGLAILLGHYPSANEIQKIKDDYNCSNITVEVDPDSPFSVDRIGPRYMRDHGDHDGTAVRTDAEALELAEYYLWLYARLPDSVTLTTDIIPFMEANLKFGYRHGKTKEAESYIVKQFTIEIAESAATMSITASRFCPLYPDIITGD